MLGSDGIEYCDVPGCDDPARHKVEEVVEDEEQRHPFSAHLCCFHFTELMGEASERYCYGPARHK